MADKTINELTASSVRSLSDLIATWNLNDASTDNDTKQQLLNQFLAASNAWTAFQTFSAGLSATVGPSSIALGSSGGVGNLGGAQFGDLFADAGNTTTVETILYTVSIPSNTLGINGDKVIAWLAGITTQHATNTRQIRVYFGSNINTPGSDTLIYDSTAQATTPTGGSNWELNVKVIRVSSTVVRCSVTFLDNLNLTTWPNAQYTVVTPSSNLTNPSYILVTGTSSSSTNDIVAKVGAAEWKSAS